MSQMTTGRDLPGCGVVINATNGKEEVVVTGGKLGTTEVYTVESNQWRKGTAMPFALWDAESLPYEDSFLILGGSTTYPPVPDMRSEKIFQVCSRRGDRYHIGMRILSSKIKQ